MFLPAKVFREFFFSLDSNGPEVSIAARLILWGAVRAARSLGGDRWGAALWAGYSRRE
jgi:hypothetical protein